MESKDRWASRSPFLSLHVARSAFSAFSAVRIQISSCLRAKALTLSYRVGTVSSNDGAWGNATGRRAPRRGNVCGQEQVGKSPVQEGSARSVLPEGRWGLLVVHRREERR